ncbi:MAG: hypothetical protein R8M38_02140 [Mariprofundaceae bacterium]
MLAEKDIEQVEAIVRQVLDAQPESLNANVRYELDLRERTVRVEEELKHQRELMIQGFDQVDKRFEDLISQMNKRFEQVDKRFEQIDKRFEQVEKRFESVDTRFEQMHLDMNKGFVEMNRRLDRFMYWTMGLVVSAVVIVLNYK